MSKRRKVFTTLYHNVIHDIDTSFAQLRKQLEEKQNKENLYQKKLDDFNRLKEELGL